MSRLTEAARPRVDPELRAQLRNAGEHDRVEAVLALRSPRRTGGPPPPAEVERAVSDLLRRVADETGTEGYEVNVFGFLASFAVAAEPQFLDRLLRQPEIASATANRPSPSGD